MADGAMERYFDTREEASAAAAAALTAALSRRLELQGDASLVVSGGSTPGRTFELLSAAPLAWQDVHVVPSDERWVAADHDDSNERLVREKLLVNEAANARLSVALRGRCRSGGALSRSEGRDRRDSVSVHRKFAWHGKRRAFRIAVSPTRKTWKKVWIRTRSISASRCRPPRVRI